MSFKLTFSGNRRPDEYYKDVFAIIDAHKSSSLRQVAQALTDAGYATPTGLAFDRTRLSGFLRTTPRTI